MPTPATSLVNDQLQNLTEVEIEVQIAIAFQELRNGRSGALLGYNSEQSPEHGPLQRLTM